MMNTTTTSSNPTTTSTSTTTTTYTVAPTVPQSTMSANSSSLFDINLNSLLNANLENQTRSVGTSNDYQQLVTEIQNTIKKNDTLFQQIQQSNYPNAGSYTSDLMNFKIDAQISDLTKTRGQIWDFINKKYNENTQLKKFYYDENRKADEYILTQTEELSRLNETYSSSLLKDSTVSEKLKQEKYQIEQVLFYRYMYYVLFVVGLVCVVLLGLRVSGVFGGGLIIVLLILLLTAGWVVYYLFYKTISRSNRSWDRVEFDRYLYQKNPESMLLNSGVVNSVNDDKKKVAKVVGAMTDSEKSLVTNKGCTA